MLARLQQQINCLHGAGTGKSTYINRHLVQGLPKESWAPIFITFSARTTANMAQEQVCTCLGFQALKQQQSGYQCVGWLMTACVESMLGATALMTYSCCVPHHKAQVDDIHTHMCFRQQASVVTACLTACMMCTGGWAAG